MIWGYHHFRKPPNDRCCIRTFYWKDRGLHRYVTSTEGWLDVIHCEDAHFSHSHAILSCCGHGSKSSAPMLFHLWKNMVPHLSSNTAITSQHKEPDTMWLLLIETFLKGEKGVISSIFGLSWASSLFTITWLIRWFASHIPSQSPTISFHRADWLYLIYLLVFPTFFSGRISPKKANISPNKKANNTRPTRDTKQDTQEAFSVRLDQLEQRLMQQVTWDE